MSKAKLPALPRVATGNAALDNWVQAVSERLEVREGARGDRLEQVITRRDLEILGLDTTRWASTTASTATGGLLVSQPEGGYATISMDAFSEELRKTKLYRDLALKLNDVSRFDAYPDEVKALLLNSIADEAAKRGAEVRRLDSRIQDETKSLAYTLTEVTASMTGSLAGVRDVMFASATESNATAGKVTQIEARLDDVGGVTIEDAMIATADAVTGLEGQYTVKVNAGGAVAGFGLAATESLAGATTSAFIVQADKFAVVSPGYGNHIPFGVDASGAYINGSLRVNATGATLDSLATATGVYISYDTQFFKYTSTGTASNTTVNLTANLTGTLTGFVTWSVLSGYTGTVPTAGTTNSWALAIADMTGDSASFQATKVDGGTTYTDTVTVAKLRDGSDSVIGLLTNESHTLPASSGGVVSAWTGAGGTFKVYQGLTDITTTCAFSVLTNTSALTGTTPIIGAATGVYSITGAGSWADASNLTSITFRATFGTTTIDKVFSLSKSLTGTVGQGQVKGTSFKRGASVTTPTGGTFASPTATSAGWTDGIPADDNTPLWMSTRLFTSDGLSPQQAVWTTPAKVGTPSTGIRSVFSVLGTTASIGATDATWHVTPATTDVFMATQTSTDNGVTWGAITGKVQIKGEQGAQGETGVGSLTLYAELDGLTSFPGRLAGKAKWSASTSLTEANAITADTAATTTVCTARGLAVSTANLELGDTVTLKSTPGGVTWTAGSIPAFGAATIQSIAYGNGVYVAVGASGYLATSTNGTSWTARTSTFGTTAIDCVHFYNGLFVIGGASGKRAWSEDGITWTATAVFGAGTENVAGITCSNTSGIWTAVGGAKAETSVDGRTWVASGTVFGTKTMYAVAFGAGMYVAVGSAGAIYTSTNGAAWTVRTSSSTADINSVAYGDGRFVTVDALGRVAVNSSPTLTWPTPTAVTTAFYGVAYGNRQFVAVGASGALYTSPDAGTWTSRTSGFSTTAIYGVCLGNGQFVACGASAKTSYAAAPTPASVSGYWGGTNWLTLGVSIDGNLIVSGTISSEALSAEAINGKTITGGTITGATIQTAATGARIVMDASKFVSYGTSPSDVVRIEPAFTYAAVYASLTGSVIVPTIYGISAGAATKAIWGQNTGTGTGVAGETASTSLATTQAGVSAYCATGGWALYCSGPSMFTSGLTFPAVFSNNTNANTLDDYEETDFSATVALACGSGTATCTTKRALATKIGDTVHFNIVLVVSAISAPSGTLSVTGLPHASRATTGYGICSVWLNTLAATATGAPQGVLSPGGTSVALSTYAAGTADTTNLSPALAVGTLIGVSGVYQT